MKNADALKEIFINYIGISSYPAITMMDVGRFVNETKVLEGAVN